MSAQSQVFLVVANSRETEPELSVIYRWSPQHQRFLRHQTLETHTALDWEAFSIHGHAFLVVANHRRGEQDGMGTPKPEPGSEQEPDPEPEPGLKLFHLSSDSNHNINSVIYCWNPHTQVLSSVLMSFVLMSSLLALVSSCSHILCPQTPQCFRIFKHSVTICPIHVPFCPPSCPPFHFVSPPSVSYLR